MKKIIFFSFITAMTFVLAGCTDTEDFILKQSGAVSEEEYQQYVEMRNKGELDTDGKYISKELADMENENTTHKSVHVTFSRNSAIEIQYYFDAMHEKLIDENQCYVNPGDCIYAAEVDSGIERNVHYSLQGFRVYSFGPDDKKELLQGEETESREIHVPDDFGGNEISVIPIGQYDSRRIELKDFYKDSVGRESKTNGEWIVNEKKVTGNSIEINPVEAVIVDYYYDSEKYVFESSNPDSLFHDEGLVRFETVDALEDISEFSVELRPLSGFFAFDPEEYIFENGNVKFEYEGRIIEERSNIPDGSILTYIVEPNEGYIVAKNTEMIRINAKDSEATKDQISNCVAFYSQKMIDVTLPRPIGGTVEYSTDGKVISGSNCKLSSGTVLTMNFNPWNGWKSKVKDGEKYIVTDQTKQSVSIQGIDINSGVFEESETYKPILKIVLDDSVKDAIFDVENIKNGLKYDGGEKASTFLNGQVKKERIIFNEKIATYPNPILNISDDAVLTGNAIKMEIVKVDKNKKEEKETIYIQKIPIGQEIEIYSSEDRETSSKIYDTINVFVSNVEVVSYEEKPMGNAKTEVSVSDVTTPYVLHSGDVLEKSRNVEIRIVPDEGYYIAGTKDMDGIYRETMKYSKWNKDYEKIMKKHSAKKIWHVTLDANDEFGTCVYQLDGEAVSGNVAILEEQKLTLNYTVTDSDYEIKRSGVGGFWKGITHKETEECTIPMSKEMDGKVIKREDYIQITPKEK